MMSFFLNWFTTHIAPVIQALAGLIICLLLIFAYRLFFVKSAKSDSIGSESNPTLDFIEEKLNKLLMQQSALKVTATSMAANGDISSEHIGEISRLKEILSEKENEILNLRNSSPLASSSSVDAVSQAASGQTNDLSAQEIKKLNDQLSLYQTQIDDLKSRLSDYEIIAEDIADLQKFKKENEMLKDQLANAGVATETVENKPEEMPVLTEEEKSLHLADENPEPVVEPTQAAVKPATDNPKQDEIDSLFAEFSSDAAQAASTTQSATDETIDTTITENEKSLIDDFSKTQKG